MAWLRIDDKFAHHPKILALTDREFRLHVLALCYCAEYGTAGTVPDSARQLLKASDSVTKRLVNLGLWDEKDGVYSIHDWRAYNPVDPTSASRKQRFRERHGNGQGTETGTAEERSSRARVPSRTRSTEEEPPAAADAREHDAAAANTIERLEAIGLNATILDRYDHQLVTAWLDLADQEAETNPAGLVITGLRTGQPPSPRNGAAPPVDFVERGRELYERTGDLEAVDDWLAGQARLSIAERERILQQIAA